MVCHRQNDGGRLGRNKHHVIREALHSNALDSAFAQTTWPRRARHQTTMQRIEHRFEYFAKLTSKARALILIPSGGSLRFKRSRLEDMYRAH